MEKEKLKRDENCVVCDKNLFVGELALLDIVSEDRFLCPFCMSLYNGDSELLQPYCDRVHGEA
tara:strand:- start:357 stop:545 length:189 start_codon:yes stop_codon:yes gene_type:complete